MGDCNSILLDPIAGRDDSGVRKALPPTRPSVRTTSLRRLEDVIFAITMDDCEL